MTTAQPAGSAPSSHVQQRQTAPQGPQHGSQRESQPDSQPNSHGKFSLGEDWIATIAGLVLLVGCLLGIVPNIGGWF